MNANSNPIAAKEGRRSTSWQVMPTDQISGSDKPESWAHEQIIRNQLPARNRYNSRYKFGEVTNGRQRQ